MVERLTRLPRLVDILLVIAVLVVCGCCGAVRPVPAPQPTFTPPQLGERASFSPAHPCPLPQEDPLTEKWPTRRPTTEAPIVPHTTHKEVLT